MALTAPQVCGRLQESLGELFHCSMQGAYVRIRTPYLYPDGDIIDVFCKEEGDGSVVVSDMAETTRWLRMQAVSGRRSVKQQALLGDVALNHGVELFRGMLTARLRQGDNLAQVATRVAQAALRASDLWFTFRTRTFESVTDEVAEFLTQEEVPFVRGDKLPGRSGRVWAPDFHTRLPRRSSLVYVLSTGSRSAARAVAEHVLAAWYDLSHYRVGPEGVQFVSLFDDTEDVWSPEDFRLVEPLSTLARWSDPQGFGDLLKAA